MILRQEMIKLNRIKIAYSEEDMKRLAADGYEPVPDGKKPKGSAGADNRQGAGALGGAGITEGSAEAVPPAEKPEETIKAVKKASKGSKKPAAEEKPEDAGTDREPESAGGEDQDAG